MAMKLIKKMAEYKIFMRGDDRYAVQDSNGKPVNGEEKVRILMEEDLIRVTLPSPKEEAPECDGAEDSGDGAKEVAAEADDAAEEAEVSDDAGEPEPGPEPEETPEGAAPEAEPEPEVGAEEAEDEGEAESEEKDK